MLYQISDFMTYSKELAGYKLDKFSSGNMSLRLSEGRVAIKPSGFAYEEIKFEDISIVDLGGNHLSGKNPSSDLMMHLEIFRAKEEVNCIIHTHSHFATVMSCLNRPLKVLTTLHADYFGKEIYCMHYTNHRHKNIGTEAVKSGENIMLLERHGALIFGDNIKNLIRNIVILEEISKLNFNIETISPGLRPIQKDDISKLYDYYSKKYCKTNKNW